MEIKNSNGQKLVLWIENQTGKKVNFINERMSSHIGQGSIDDSGVPTVKIDTSKYYDESIIVHELYHIKMRLDGYPEVFLEYDASKMDLSDETLDELLLRGRDPIEHFIFYPILRKMGYDPDKHRRSEIEEIFANNAFSNEETLSYADIALRYFTCMMEVEDSVLKKQFDEFVLKKSVDGAILGRQMVNAVYKYDFKGYDAPSKAFVECMNLIFKTKFHFTLLDIKEQTKGDLMLKKAIVQIDKGN